MNKNHIICLIVALIVGYVVGIYYPSIGQSAIAKVTSAA